MKIILNSKSPIRIEVLLNPGDELEVSPELGSRLLGASPNLREVPAKGRAKPRARKGSS
ncbi:hypothetical protein LCGC14_1402340 [marine sediment metagenome]|uniref:Uncharacterized protein n=1 Tax=marine sediment metagenome TaxID=412755 RepID=A0A0F9MY86_9ZZZZ